jgi:hypothetical protein
MTLSAPVSRQPIHSRRVTCQGFHRDDGLWDIEARLVDTKAYDFVTQNDRATVHAGEAVHEMVMRVTIDDTFRIHAVEAETVHAPFFLCGDAAPAMAQLVGLSLGHGFQRQLRERLGGVKGCTHLVELMGPIATTAFQTIFPLVHVKRAKEERPAIIDQCHALAADGPVVARLWPEHASPAPLERKDAAQ